MRIEIWACMFLIGLAGARAPAEPPRVVAAIPDHGDAGVDPALAELRIVFDRDMRTGMSLCGGGATFPRATGRAHWLSPRELAMPVALEPGRHYDLSVNCRDFRQFQSLEGEACEVTPISFDTAARGETPAAPARLTGDQTRSAFDALRRAIDGRYSYRDRVVADWAGALEPHRQAILESATPAQFARNAARALGCARDVHLALAVNSATFPTFRAEPALNVRAEALARLVPRFTRASGVVATGVFDDGVAYVQINAWPSDGAPLGAAHEFLTEHADAPGVIIDVRLNGGGDERSARGVAGRFVRTRTVYSQARTRDPSKPGGWSAAFKREVSPDDAADGKTGAARRPCAAPVVVLIGQGCMSSNESFILMMKHGAAATLVGDRTFGTSGNPRPVELGFGVVARVPTWEDLFPDGTPLEGRGIEPDIPAALGAGEGDGVLEAALTRLRAGTR